MHFTCISCRYTKNSADTDSLRTNNFTTAAGISAEVRKTTEKLADNFSTFRTVNSRVVRVCDNIFLCSVKGNLFTKQAQKKIRLTFELQFKGNSKKKNCVKVDFGLFLPLPDGPKPTVNIYVELNVKMEASNNTDTGDTNNAQPAVPVTSPRIPLVRMNVSLFA